MNKIESLKRRWGQLRKERRYWEADQVKKEIKKLCITNPCQL